MRGSNDEQKPTLRDVEIFATVTLALAGEADAPHAVLDNLLEALRALEHARPEDARN